MPVSTHQSCLSCLAVTLFKILKSISVIKPVAATTSIQHGLQLTGKLGWLLARARNNRGGESCINAYARQGRSRKDNQSVSVFNLKATF